MTVKLFCVFDLILKMRACLHCRAVISCNRIRCCQVKPQCMQKPLSAVACLTEGSWVVEAGVLKICNHSASLASASCDRLSNGSSSNPNVSGPPTTNNPQPVFKKSAQSCQSKQVSCQQPSEGSETL